MSEEEKRFLEIGNEIDKAIKGQLFGKSCFKMGKKAFICFFQNCMVFKLNQPHHEAAMKLSNSVLFDPSGKNRPMKEWVQLSFEHQEVWKEFSEHAKAYILSLT